MGRNALPAKQRTISLDFSQTCPSFPVTKAGCPIQARFWLEWYSTALDRQLCLLQRIPRSMIIYILYSQRSRSVIPLKPKPGLNGAPSFGYR
jgi:hypothetical protein